MDCGEADELTPGLVAFVLGKTVGLGRVAGGLTGAAILTDLTGRKAQAMSPAVLALRWKAGSGSLRSWVCRGLEGSDVGATTGEVLRGSKVSRTTSGVCLTLLCLSSSRSSFKAEFIVASISCAMTSGSMGRWLLKLFDLPAVAVFRICGLSNRFFRDEWRLMELRLPCPLMEHLSGPSLGRLWLMMGWEDGRQLAPTPGEEESVRELLSPWLSLRNVFRMLPDSGRFLCLQSQRERAG